MNDWKSISEQHGVASTDDLAAIGVDKSAVTRRLADGELERVAPSTYVVGGSPRTWRQRLTAAVAHGGDTAVAAGRAAAAIYGLPGFEGGTVDVVRLRQRHHRGRIGGLRETTFLPPHHRREVGGIAVMSPARLMLDLCGIIKDPKRMGRVIDDALLMGLVTVAELGILLAEAGRRGRRGTALLRMLVRQRTGDYVPTESELEDLVIAVLTEAGLELPDRQVHVGGDELIGRVDFKYAGRPIVIEAQSRRHHSSWSAQSDDEVRHQRLMAAGFVVIAPTWQQLTDDPEPFLAAVRASLEVHPR